MWLLLRVLPAFRCFLLRVAHRGVGYRHSDWPDLYQVYASRVKKNPLLSRVHESDPSFVKSRLMLNNVRLPLVTGGIDCPDRRNGLGYLGRDR